MALVLPAMLLAIPAAGIPALAGSYPDQKVVYHNDGSSEPDYFVHLLANIHNHIEAVGQDHVQILVVDNGAGVGLLQEASDDAKLAARIDALRAEGVRFLICANTMRSRGIGVDDLYGATQDDVVPSGVAEIAKLEQEGFVYLHP